MQKPVMQVHVPLYDPSSVMLLAVCSAQPKVHRARVLTRAVRSVLAQVCTATLLLLTFLLLGFHSHANALYILTKKAVPQFPSLQLVHILVYSARFAVCPTANPNVLAHSPCHVADSEVPMLHHWSTHVSKMRAHGAGTQVMVPIMGAAEKMAFSHSHIGQS